MPASPEDRWAAAPASHGAAAREDHAHAESARSSSPLTDEELCHRFLDGKTPGELIELFSHADPLRLFERSARYLWEEALLVEPERIAYHLAARVAAMASLRPRAMSLDAWLLDCLAFVARDLVTRDREDERLGQPVVDPWGARQQFICEAIGCPLDDARRRCVAFNGLSRGVRKIFFALVMERRSVEECLEMGLGPGERLRAGCRTALDRLLGLGESPGPESNGGEGEATTR